MKKMGIGLRVALFTILFVFAMASCESPTDSPKSTVVNIVTIQGVNAPANGGTPVRTITGNAQYSGTVTWSPDHSTFAPAMQYTATIILTPKDGFTLEGVRDNFFSVARAISVTNAANSGVITAVFPLTASTNIDSVAISVTAPVKSATPNTTASGTGNFTIGAVSWSPTDNPFLGDKVYTATVTLTANSGYTFTGLNSATINGQTATVSNNTGVAVTLSYTFPATDTKTVTNIAIKTQPAKMTYTYGDKLDLTGLVVTLTYDDTTTEDVAAANFAAKNITAKPAQNTNLAYSTHNGKPVILTCGTLTCTTNNLTVKATGTWVNTTAINTTYTPTLTLGDVTLPAGYAFTMPTTKLNAGNGQSFSATYTNPNGNWEAANGTITVNVAKSGPASWPTASAITYGSPLSSSVLSGGDTAAGSFAWTNSATLPTVTNDGYSVTFTPVNNNYTTTTRIVAITVNKAVGEVVNTPTLSGYAHNGILLNAVIAATGQNVEYGISTSNNANTAVWQTRRNFTGLKAGTTYYIFARTVGNANYNTGTASDSLQVTTRSSNVLTVTTTAEWNTALALIAAFGNGTAANPQTYTITVAGDVPISGTYYDEYSFGDVSNVVVTLNGNGKLYLSNQGNILSIASDQTVIIDSDNLILDGTNQNNAGGVYVGVYVYLGTLSLRNGTISGNTGGGVSVGGGTFSMIGGMISGNTGSGVSVSLSGTFSMSGGKISGNTSNSSGGGVAVLRYGNFFMSGGEISGNTATNSGGSSAPSYGGAGGGVYLYATYRTGAGGYTVLEGNANFFKTGGTIKDNTVKNSSGTVVNNRGHQVWAYSMYNYSTVVIKHKETTVVGPEVTLSFYGSDASFSGAWD